MKIIRPTALFVKKAGDTMTGTLRIERAGGGHTDPHLELKATSAGAGAIVLKFIDQDGREGFLMHYTGDGSMCWDTYGIHQFKRRQDTMNEKILFKSLGIYDEMKRLFVINSIIWG
jgi:hypothetical protein